MSAVLGFCNLSTAAILADGDWSKLIAALDGCDEAVAAQAAALLRGRGVSLQEPALEAALKKAGGPIERGFRAYAEAWRESQIARAQPR